MTTTPPPPVSPDYYNSAEECIASLRNVQNSNPRYPEFKQDIFHAGDEEQFQHYRDAVNNMSPHPPDISLKNNLFRDLNIEIWDGFYKINASAVLNTYRYMTKFKKAIFVKIVDNSLRVFLPFSVADYTNEWGNQIKVDPSKYSSIEDFLRHVSDIEGRKYRIKFLKATDTWYANNCLVRYDDSEHDTNISNLRNMLQELCAERTVPDIEFFINRRDFPVMREDYTEPYNHMLGSNVPLLSHKHTKYAPIFSMCTIIGEYADILMPCWEDWIRVQSYDQKWIPRGCKSYVYNFNTPWSDKIPTAVFRGSSTGCGVTIDTNQRLKLAFLSSITPPDSNGIPYLDAGITKWNARPRKLENNPYLQTIDPSTLSFGLKQILTPEEQSKYKYIVNVDGHVTAYRLSLELSMGSVILLVDSEWTIWYKDLLQPYEHYVPVKHDLSNLIDQIQWCRDNDEECQEIANNAKEFFNTYLQRKGVLDYMQKTLEETKYRIGTYTYNNINPLQLQYNNEHSTLLSQLYHPPVPKNNLPITSLPPVPHTLGFYTGISWLLNYTGTPPCEQDKTVTDYASVKLYGRTAPDQWTAYRIIHGLFIGKMCIDTLPMRPPNFPAAIGLYDSVALYEYVEGQSLKDYIHSPQLNSKQLILILVQTLLAIKVAQDGCAFVHWDLRPSNIIIKKLNRPETHNYTIDANTTISIKSTHLPIITSFEHAHAIHENIHHGIVDMFSSNPSQDSTTLLLTTLREMLVYRKQPLDKQTYKDAMSMINLIANFPSAVSAKTYLRNHVRRYTPIIDPQKTFDMTNMRPMNLIQSLTKIADSSLPIRTIKSTEHPFDSMPLQVFEFAIAQSDEERLASYLNAFKKISTCEQLTKTNKFTAYYSAQLINSRLTWLQESLAEYIMFTNLEFTGLERQITNVVRNTQSTLQQLIDSSNTESFNIKLPNNYTEIEQVPYSENTFLDHPEIHKLLQQYPLTSCKNLSTDKNTIISILSNDGKFKLSSSDMKFYLKDFAPILSTNSIAIANNPANIYTLHLFAEKCLN